MRSQCRFERRRRRNRVAIGKVNRGRPRLSVFRSGKHIYAQVIDDSTGRTIAQANSREAGVVEGVESSSSSCASSGSRSEVVSTPGSVWSAGDGSTEEGDGESPSGALAASVGVVAGIVS